MQRFLLGFLTAILVARPLVLGEDPGLLDRLSGTANLFISVLWLAGLVLWAIYRGLCRRVDYSLGLSEAGLALTTLAVILSTLFAAAYKRPAGLICWEWLILVGAFFLVRDLGSSTQDGRRFLAAILATGVCLAGQGIYQAVVELPANRAELDDPQVLRRELAKINVVLSEDDQRIEFWKERVAMDHVFATYAHPNSFAGVLALIVPAAVAAAWAQGRGGLRRMAGIIVVTGTACLLAALWLTHSRGAILGLGLAAALAAAMGWRPSGFRMASRRAAAVLGAGLLVCGLVLQTDPGKDLVAKAQRSLGARIDYWRATTQMIIDHPWLGVGPGNFGRHYPQYMAATAHEKIQDPHNFFLEMWSTAGILAALALAITLLASLYSICKTTPSLAQGPVGKQAQPSTEPTQSTIESLPRWEFYIGGMAGLLIGFILRASELSKPELIREIALSGCRTLVWLIVFRALERMSVPGPAAYRWGIAGGIVACSFNLLVSGGISSPSVNQWFWVLVALGLNLVRPIQPACAQKWRLSTVWPIPVSLAFGAVYVVFVVLPINDASARVADARRHFGDDPDLPGWRNAVLPEFQRMAKTAGREETLRLNFRASRFLETNILRPLEQAARIDSWDAQTAFDLAYWRLEQLRIQPSSKQVYKTAMAEIQRLQQLDPFEKGAYLVESQLHQLLAGVEPGEKKVHLGRAVLAHEKALQLDPTTSTGHFEMAALLLQTDQPSRAKSHARKALELDRISDYPTRKLPGKQRDQLRVWLER